MKEAKPGAMGLTWEQIESAQKKGTIPRQAICFAKTGDYGADPTEPAADGSPQWRMVPSGDIVGAEERRRRLECPR